MSVSLPHLALCSTHLASRAFLSFLFPAAGPAGRDPRSLLQQDGRCLLCDSGYLRHAQGQYVGTRPRCESPSQNRWRLECREEAAQGDTSTRSSRHSILNPGPAWIYYRSQPWRCAGRLWPRNNNGAPTRYDTVLRRAGDERASGELKYCTSVRVRESLCGNRRLEISSPILHHLPASTAPAQENKCRREGRQECFCLPFCTDELAVWMLMICPP
jgi:hypothetical protein